MRENDRLLTLMKKENLNARQFAEQVGVQPATLSNILNGRNKPSLDVLQRIIYAFPKISPEWLFIGNGPMYRVMDGQPTLFDMEEKAEEPEVVKEDITQIGRAARKSIGNKTIQKVVVFYSDGTFKEII